MALENLVTVELTPAEITTLQTALDDIKNIIQPKAHNLTPSERQAYGRVRYEFEVWIDKCRGHMSANPTLVPSYIDTAEYEKDYAAREAMKPLEQKLQQLYEMFDDTFVLLGHDLYVNSIAFYRSVKVAAKSNVPGSTAIYEDLKQQFPGGRPAEDPEPPTP